MTDEIAAPRRVRQRTWLRVYRRCRHHYICLVNDGRLLHPTPTMDVCDLGAADCAPARASARG